MHHDTPADPSRAVLDVRAGLGHDTAWLMPGNDGAADLAQPERSRAACGAIELEVAATHPGCLDLDHDIVWARRRVGKLSQFQLALPKKGHAAHAISPAMIGRAVDEDTPQPGILVRLPDQHNQASTLQ
jgi:hypothetical protein